VSHSSRELGEGVRWRKWFTAPLPGAFAQAVDGVCGLFKNGHQMDKHFTVSQPFDF
jgi:hypothetical protein